FAALFFVSVGMLVDPALLWRQLPLFVLLVAVVLSKGLVVALLCRLLRRCSARTAVLVRAGPAPSAQVSFLLALLGVGPGGVSGEAVSLRLAAPAATLVLAPALYRLAPAASTSDAALDPGAPELSTRDSADAQSTERR